MFPWERKEVLVTNDTQRLGLAESALQEAGMKYETRIVNGGSRNRRAGAVGGFGEDMRLSVMYYVYVKKEDSEQAEYLIHNTARG